HSSDRNPIFLFHCYGDTRHLHSFPTRRSSDLALGSKIKEVHLSSSIGVDPQLFSFLEEGDNRVQTPAYRLDAANVLSPSSCPEGDRKSTRLNSSHVKISYAVFCLKKKKGMRTT